MSDTMLGFVLISFVFGVMTVGLICLAVATKATKETKETKKGGEEKETKPSPVSSVPELPEGLRVRLERAQKNLANAFAEADAAATERDAALERVRAKKNKRETEKLNASLAPESGEAGESASSTKTNGGNPVVGDDHGFTVPASAPPPNGGKKVRAIIVRTELTPGGAVEVTYRMPCGASEIHDKVSDHLVTCVACHAKM